MAEEPSAPRAAETFDGFAEDYDAVLDESLGACGRTFGQDYFARYKVEIVRKLVSRSPASVLEYGCGTGRNLAYLREAFPGARVSGCDVSRTSLEVARRENPGCSLFHVDEVDRSTGFELVLVAGVLHHVAPGERAAVTEDITTLLAPGADLFVFEHNPYNPVTRRIVAACAFDEGVVLLPPREVRRLVEGAGLTVTHRGYRLVFPRALSFLRGTERIIGRLPVGGQHFVHAVRGDRGGA